MCTIKNRNNNAVKLAFSTMLSASYIVTPVVGYKCLFLVIEPFIHSTRYKSSDSLHLNIHTSLLCSRQKQYAKTGKKTNKLPTIFGEILKCACDGHFTIPWGHGRGFVNGNIVVQLMLVGLHTDYSYYSLNRSLNCLETQLLILLWLCLELFFMAEQKRKKLTGNIVSKAVVSNSVPGGPQPWRVLFQPCSNTQTI